MTHPVIQSGDAGLGVPEARLIRAGLDDIGALIERTRVEVAGLALEHEPASRLCTASGELDAVVGATEAAAEQIMTAAEVSQACVQRLRALPDLPDAARPELDAMDGSAIDIFTACSFQDLTGQRIRKVVQALTYIEGRVRSLNTLWQGYDKGGAPPSADTRPDAALLNGPSANGLAQSSVDALLLAAAPSSQADIDALFG